VFLAVVILACGGARQPTCIFLVEDQNHEKQTPGLPLRGRARSGISSSNANGIFAAVMDLVACTVGSVVAECTSAAALAGVERISVVSLAAVSMGAWLPAGARLCPEQGALRAYPSLASVSPVTDSTTSRSGTASSSGITISATLRFLVRLLLWATTMVTKGAGSRYGPITAGRGQPLQWVWLRLRLLNNPQQMEDTNPARMRENYYKKDPEPHEREE
jgi:hypothetical protein